MTGSMASGLETPVWTALTTRQAQLGLGTGLARRYLPEVAPFAAVASETPAAFGELLDLLGPNEQVAVLSEAGLPPIEAARVTSVGVVHQMVATGTGTGSGGPGRAASDVLCLTAADAPEMLELALATKPGPFGKRTHEMGRYIGVREQGRLVAMAGERMCMDGFVEVSAVCVDDAWRGKGLAGRLVSAVRARIEAHGATAFLHVFSENVAAIGLYERLGFELSRRFFLYRIGHAEEGARGA